jgi:squalene synthase HpnC
MRQGAAARSAPPSAEAVMAKAASENFPVASRLLPRATRAHLLNIYGFARLVDDLGDEVAGDRLGHLAWLQEEVNLLYVGTPTHALMRRLVPTVRRFEIPPEPFLQLIAANRQDQQVSEYATFADLRAYCELSANPVGHLVLMVLEAVTPRRLRLSDSVCTGLQLVEHWQDVAEDLGRGRVYVPREDLQRFGVTHQDLAAARPGHAMRRLMAFEVDRARELLDQGAPLARDLGGRAGFAVAAFVAGGRSALDAIARAGYDVLSTRPRPSAGRRLWELVRTLAALGGAARAVNGIGSST